MNYIEIAQSHAADLYPLLVYGKPQLSDLPPGAIIGTWAYSVPGKVRFMLDKSREIVPGVLPGDLTRAWLRDEYQLPIKLRRDQQQKSYSVPLHAKLGTYGECAYVDIKGAYLNILKMGYDLEYIANRYLGANPRSVPAEIKANKLSYSLAVSMASSSISNMEVMGKEGTFNRRSFNLYSNPCLYNLAADTLNGIGAEILAVLGDKVHYVNTDGYIVDSGYEQYAIDIVRSWGFEARVKHRGETMVRGVGSWKVGDQQTRRFDQQAADYTSPLMDRDSRRWLKSRWASWSPALPD